MISEVSVHRQPSPFLGARGEAEHHGGRVWWRQAAYMIIRKQERESAYQIQNIYPKGTPPPNDPPPLATS